MTPKRASCGIIRRCVSAPNGIATLASVAAAVAFTGAALGTDGTTTPVTTTTSAAPPCVGAGIVAILEPDAAAATTVGPALAVSVRTGLAPAPFSDAATGVQLTDAQVGAAGCVGGTAPGGATARSGAWSVFGGAVSGTSLRADLLPTSDGSDWHLRAKVEGLKVGGTAADPIAGSSIAVGDWAVLDVHALVDGKAVQPLRYWASALELTLTKPHAGLPVGTRVLLGDVAANRRLRAAASARRRRSPRRPRRRPPRRPRSSRRRPPPSRRRPRRAPRRR